MRIAIVILLLIVAITALSRMEAVPRTTPIVFPNPKGWPAPVYDFSKNPLTREGFELGRKLFYEERLSKDGTISCAGCHQQFGAFATYDHTLSHGLNNSFTNRNAPALQNLAWQPAFMWDGGITHLDLQPLAPLTAAHEMGLTIAEALTLLKNDSAYRRMFRAAFGSPVITTSRMSQALSQFLLMLVSSNSRFDQVSRGEQAFTAQEKMGFETFRQKCEGCHKEPFFTDFSYRNTGMTVDSTLGDHGRIKITGKAEDDMKFKVPSLRNVAYTYPYGHDGRFFSLQQVYEHYRNSISITPLTDSLLQRKIPLSNLETSVLTAFLRTLTDTVFMKNPEFAPPGYAITPIYMHYR